MSASKPTDLSFEQAMERLEEIVAAMESERMPLDQMVSAYEEGTRLLQNCRQRIDNARQRIESISLKADSRAELTAFEPGSDEPSEEKMRSSPPPRRRPTPTKPESADGGDEIRLF